MSGMLWGTQLLYLQNSMIFHDKEHQMKAHLTFRYDQDKFVGALYKYDSQKFTMDNSINFDRLQDISYTICQVSGFWQSKLLFDDEVAWDINRVKAAGAHPRRQKLQKSQSSIVNKVREDLKLLTTSAEVI